MSVRTNNSLLGWAAVINPERHQKPGDIVSVEEGVTPEERAQAIALNVRCENAIGADYYEGDRITDFGLLRLDEMIRNTRTAVWSAWRGEQLPVESDYMEAIKVVLSTYPWLAPALDGSPSLAQNINRYRGSGLITSPDVLRLDEMMPEGFE